MVCIAVVALRIVGLHLHLCLDGQEPAQTLHVADTGLHDDASHAAGTHNDVDLSLVSDGLIKKLSALDMPILPALILALLCLLQIFRIGARSQTPPASTFAIRFILPPLRAPPL